MSKSARHKLMQALVRGSTHYGAAVRLNLVEDELDELGRCDRVEPIRRRRLLKVIHAARAIDTTLGVILDANGIPPQHGIGERLDQLKTLAPATRGYPSVIAKCRATSEFFPKVFQRPLPSA